MRKLDRSLASWGRAPWSLRAYVVIALASSVVTAVTASAPVPSRVFSVSFTGVVCFFLLRGVRWLWVLAIVFILLGLAANITGGDAKWYGVVIGVVGLVLLLLPDTRRFFRNEDSWAKTLLQAVVGVLAGTLGVVALLGLLLLANVLFLHVPLSTR